MVGKRGCGFSDRCDNIHKKDQDFASISPDGVDGLGKVKRKAENRPGIEKFLAELNTATFKPANAVTVGEASGLVMTNLDNLLVKRLLLDDF